MATAPTLAQVYRRFGETKAGASQVYGRVAVALSGSSRALRAIAAAPPRKRHPTVVLAALHDLALGGRAPALAAAYRNGDADAAAEAAIATLVGMTQSVVDVAVRRRFRSDETGRCTVLHPAIAEVTHRLGADAVGLIDIGCGSGLNLSVDRVGIRYENGPSLGDPSSPVQQSAMIRGERRVPMRGLPEVVARVGIDREPLDVSDADDARWLRACVSPDQRDRAERLDAEIALAAADPPLLLRGDAVELLPEALDRVPAGALPIVMTTWALSAFAADHRLRFIDRLAAAAAHRRVAWVSTEGVGVAPGVSTLGDRGASGHSLLGLAIFDGPARRVETIGRCWGRGRWLEWLVEP